MEFEAVTDWDDAYENGRHIPGGSAWPDAWVAPAAAFRDRSRARLGVAYGEGARHRYDLFMPERMARGLLVFVHGGYWVALDRSYWSHLAAGAVGRGWACAVPSYDLCPDATIPDIARQVGRAIDHAAGAVGGPIVLAGHSAGGHLVASMAAHDTPLAQATVERLVHVVSISGLHDLRPMLRTARNALLGLDMAAAEAASPALKRPLPGVPLTAWVGAQERPEFLRQTALIANVWRGLGAATRAVVEPGRHHFDVIDGLADPASPLMEAALAPAATWQGPKEEACGRAPITA